MSVLREATLEDALSLSFVAERIFRSTFGAVNSHENMKEYCQKHFSKQVQSREISNPKITTILSLNNTDIEGFIQVWWVDAPDCITQTGPSGEIKRLYVTESSQGRGVAQKLMQAALNKVSSRGLSTAWLGVWEHNPRAIAFYEKSGFSEVGEHDFYVGEDLQRDIIMAKTLN